MTLSSMSPLFKFELEPLRQNADFILYWGKQPDTRDLACLSGQLAAMTHREPCIVPTSGVRSDTCERRKEAMSEFPKKY
jgi:hypothetical protein